MSEFSIAVLISGGGTTLRNLIEKRNAGQLTARIDLVISSHPEANGLAFAREAGIETAVFDFREHGSSESMGEKIFGLCRDRGIDLVVMGGFLRKTDIPDDYHCRVVNIHPSLIPAFSGKGMYGMRVHRSVIEAQSLLSGCTVHFVDNQYDHGPIIAQSSLKVVPGTSPEELARQVFALECELYPQVIEAIAQGQVSVTGDEVVYSGMPGRS